MKIFFTILLSLTLGNILYGQDSLQVIEPAPIMTDSMPKHSPRRAALLSAILPGAGQVYNRSYWKVPVLYAGFATLIYLNRDYNSYYDKYKGAYDAKRVNGVAPVETSRINIDGAEYSPSSVAAARDISRKYRDLSFMGICLVYLLNVVDASVDAYFYDYDISDNLALHLQPQPYVLGNQTGLVMSCTFRFKK